LSTQRGDTTSGTISGYTLRIGDGTNEAVITTPDGITGYDSSQRLVINPGKGRDGTSGEGGDIYLWAGRGGDTGGSGGDIKIRGGQGMGEGGAGGYIRMEAGDGDSAGGGAPGYIDITGGYGGSGQTGGYVHILGGTGTTGGGEANVTGGYAYSGEGGNVNLIGGGSNDGLSHYGNVNISAGASTWTFDNTGSFVFPGGGVTMDGGSYSLLTSGIANASIGTFVQGADSGVGWEYQGDGADANTSYGAVSLDTAGTANTANLQFKVQLVADQGNASTNKEWIFNTAGNLTTPGNIITGSGSGGNISGANVVSANVFIAAGNITGGSATFTGGTLTFANTTSSIINFQQYGVGAPTFTTRSEGTKIVLYDQVNGSNVDYAIGISNANLWLSIPQNSDSYNSFAWYGGQTKVMSLGGAGTLSTVGNVTGGNLLTGGLISATGNITGGNLNATTGVANVANLYLGNGYVNTSASAALNLVPGGAGGTRVWSKLVPNANVSFSLGSSTEYWANGYIGNTISTTVSATGNITGANLIATANVLGNGYARFTGTFDESQASTAGLYLGYAGGTPRMMFGTGNTSQTFEIDNDGGNLRFYQPGSTKATLTSGGDFSVAGNVTGNTAGYAIGYRDIPQVSFTGNATIATTDAGKHYYSTQSTSYTLTIANNASQGFQVGSAITIVNQGTGNITIAQGSGVTLYIAGNSTSGNRTVSTFGMATLIKVATDTWFINGTGVS
jgi:hypothetical protein